MDNIATPPDFFARELFEALMQAETHNEACSAARELVSCPYVACESTTFSIDERLGAAPRRRMTITMLFDVR